MVYRLFSAKFSRSRQILLTYHSENAIINRSLWRLHSFACRGIAMGVNYKRLWKLLIDKDMTKADLRSATDIASSTLTKMSHNEYVSLDVLVRICCALDCELNEIVEIEHDK